VSLFRPATKAQSKLRAALAGPAGSGKTWTALEIATFLASSVDGRVALIDTERGSASKYSGDFAFDVAELADFHPDRYIEAIRDAEAAGYAALVIDSLSHAWSGPGGVLDFVDHVAARNKGNKFDAWRQGTPLQNRLVDAILSSRLHVIATLRTKQEYVVERGAEGKTSVRKVGLAPVQRDQIEYEFDVFGELDAEHTLAITKSRCRALADAVIPKPGRQVAEKLLEWLNDGAPAPAPAVAPAPEAKPVMGQMEFGKAAELTLWDRWNAAVTEAVELGIAEIPALAEDAPDDFIKAEGKKLRARIDAVKAQRGGATSRTTSRS
jgi:hypothetical protein